MLVEMQFINGFSISGSDQLWATLNILINCPIISYMEPARPYDNNVNTRCYSMSFNFQQHFNQVRRENTLGMNTMATTIYFNALD